MLVSFNFVHPLGYFALLSPKLLDDFQFPDLQAFWVICSLLDLIAIWRFQSSEFAHCLTVFWFPTLKSYIDFLFF
jgi:hypothetical protein